MCGRYTVASSKPEIEERFDCDVGSQELPPRYNVAPTQESIAIVTDASGQRQGQMMRWGLVPHWAKDLSIGARFINARSETAAETAAFRVAFRKRRCLVVATGFYEWLREGKAKTPFYFSLKAEGPFAFAGLWELWKSPEGKWVRSFTILTTAANTLMSPIHNRMPVILTPETEALWLDPVTDEPKTLSKVLVPFPAEEMAFHEVSPVVNSWKTDGPECIAPAHEGDKPS
jgi:putative SOS response-associated peptidase YedK